MKDEGFLTAAGWRFVIVGALVILAGALAYFLIAEDISIDLEELTESTTTESTTEFEFPNVTTTQLDEGPYFRCIESAVTAQDIIDCTNR